MTTANLEAGTVLAGSYEIVRCIGSGGMGAVYEAKHLRLSARRVAIKVLLKDLADDEELFARFRREAEIGARLGHPHIIAVTDFDKLPGGAPFLVMEFLEGEDLAHRMAKGRVPEALVYRVVREVGGALAAAHKQGIVHRDLKPHNVFLVKVEEAEGIVEHCKVLDFGISKMAAATTVLTRDAAVLGTPRYMAPEQALGQHAEIDGRADQFALATVAYELLAGRPAFDADSATAVLFKVVYEAPAPLREVAPHVPEKVAQAIERAMSKKREERFADMTAFVSAVMDGAGPRGTATPATDDDLAPTALDAGEAARRAKARRRTVLRTAGAGLVAAVAAGGLVVVLSGAKKQRVASDSSDHAVPSHAFVEKHADRAPPSEGSAPPSDAFVEKHAYQAPPSEGFAPPSHEFVEKPPYQGAPSQGLAAPSQGSAAPSVDHGAPSKEHVAAKVVERAEVAGALDDAQRLFDGGSYRDAVNKARQSLGLQETPRGRRIIALSYCAMNDLEGARPAVAKVAPSEKRQVLERCKKLGMEF